MCSECMRNARYGFSRISLKWKWYSVEKVQCSPTEVSWITGRSYNLTSRVANVRGVPDIIFQEYPSKERRYRAEKVIAFQIECRQLLTDHIQAHVMCSKCACSAWIVLCMVRRILQLETDSQTKGYFLPKWPSLSTDGNPTDTVCSSCTLCVQFMKLKESTKIAGWDTYERLQCSPSKVPVISGGKRTCTAYSLFVVYGVIEPSEITLGSKPRYRR
jgi:hypothetical protein